MNGFRSKRLSIFFFASIAFSSLPLYTTAGFRDWWKQPIIKGDHFFEGAKKYIGWTKGCLLTIPLQKIRSCVLQAAGSKPDDKVDQYAYDYCINCLDEHLTNDADPKQLFKNRLVDFCLDVTYEFLLAKALNYGIVPQFLKSYQRTDLKNLIFFPISLATIMYYVFNSENHKQSEDKQNE